jgi:hypothetical protein
VKPSPEAQIAKGVYLLRKDGRIYIDNGAPGGAALLVDRRALLGFVLTSGAYTAADLRSLAGEAASEVRVATVLDLFAQVAKRIPRQ